MAGCNVSFNPRVLSWKWAQRAPRIMNRYIFQVVTVLKGCVGVALTSLLDVRKLRKTKNFNKQDIGSSCTSKHLYSAVGSFEMLFRDLQTESCLSSGVATRIPMWPGEWIEYKRFGFIELHRCTPLDTISAN